MLCLDPDLVAMVNSDLTGGASYVTSQFGLESALGRPLATYDGQYLHPTLVGRAGVLLEALVQNHPFLDGNKRTAWITSLGYLRIHGVELEPVPQDEAAEFVEGVVLHRYDGEAAAQWLAERQTVIP